MAKKAEKKAEKPKSKLPEGHVEGPDDSTVKLRDAGLQPVTPQDK